MASDEERSKKRRRRILLALLILLLLLLGSCCAVCMRDVHAGEDADETSSDGTALVFDESASPVSFSADAESDDEDDSVTIPGWGELEFAADRREQSVDFYNPEENAGAFYLTFSLEVKVDGGGEVVYTSGLIEPGMHVSSITLDRALAAGTYEAVLHVQPYRMDDGLTKTNNADMRTVLVVS
jgi:hypothetical protein